MKKDYLSLNVVKTLFLGMILTVLAANSFAAEYYVDPVNGSDTNTGSQSSPWKTIDFAKSTASGIAPGDTIYLKSGNYGSVELYKPAGFYGNVVYGTSWDKTITYKAVDGADVVFDSLALTAHSGEPDIARYLVFDGINVDHSVAGAAAVYITASHIKLRNMDIAGQWGNYASEISRYGIQIREAHGSLNIQEILVENCTITQARRGVEMTGRCENIAIIGNTIHKLAGSAIAISVSSSIKTQGNILIEGNHIYNQNSMSESSSNSTHTHGSGLSIRSCGVTLRANSVHNYGNSRGLRFYQDVFPDQGYSNMIVENNLFYDIQNYYPVELLDIGENCKFNNNTVIGAYRTNGDFSRTTQRYGTAVIFNNSNNWSTGSGFEFYNNVIVGEIYLRFDNPFKFKEDNNIIWGYTSSSILGNNTRIITVGDSLPPDAVSDEYFFEGSGNFFVGGSLFDQYSFRDTVYEHNAHGQNLNDAYQLASSSEAIGFANVTKAPVVDLYGELRDSDPDAGCYEYLDGSTPTEPEPEPEPDPVTIEIDPIDSQTVTEGQAVSFDVSVTVTGADQSQASCAIENLPSGASFVNNSFYWTPQAGQAGIYFLKIVATCVDANDTLYVAVTVNENNEYHAPAFDGLNDTSINEAEKLILPVSATDPDGDQVIITHGVLPDGAIYYKNQLIWVPDYGQAGIYTVAFTVSDGSNTVTRNVDITVNAVADQTYPGMRLIYYWRTTLSLLGDI